MGDSRCVAYTEDDREIEQLMVAECKRIYEETKKDYVKLSGKVWIIYNRNLSEKEEEPDIENVWLLEDGIIKNPVHYRGSTFSLADENGFFINPEMHFNILSNEQRVILTYYFGKRFARCIEYDLKCMSGNYRIENPQVVWVS